MSLFKHWSALPTYSFALSSDSIIISQFSSFVKSFFCELSVNRFSVSLENFGVRILLGSARLFLSLSGIKVYHKISFLSIPFFDLYFSAFFAVFLAVVGFFEILPFFSFLKFVDLLFISFVYLLFIGAFYNIFYLFIYLLLCFCTFLIILFLYSHKLKR